MDIIEQQEMSKSRPQVKNKLKSWYNWLVIHVPKPIKEEEQNEESFNSLELEQAFDKAYRSYRINGRSRMDVDIFLDWIR